MFYRKIILILSVGLIACLSMIGVIFLTDGGAVGLCPGRAGLGLNGDQGVSNFMRWYRLSHVLSRICPCMQERYTTLTHRFKFTDIQKS